jgi:hypothetical protein
VESTQRIVSGDIADGPFNALRYDQVNKSMMALYVIESHLIQIDSKCLEYHKCYLAISMVSKDQKKGSIPLKPAHWIQTIK